MLNGVLHKIKHLLEKNKVKADDIKESKIYNWYDDRIQKIRLQRNFMIILIVSLLCVIMFMVFSMLSVARFKTIEPFVIEISSRSGMATLVDPLTVKEYSANRKVIEYFLVKYLKSREIFDTDNYKYNYYYVVRLLSTEAVYSDFRKSISTANPSSPVNLYAKAELMRLKIRSIQYLSIDNIQVRFVLYFKIGGVEKEVNRIANLKYKFTDVPLTEEERYVNPLGFKVFSYKVDNENLV